MTGEDLEVEFEVLMKRAALAIHPDRRAELFREYKTFREATALLRQGLPPHREPSNVFHTLEFLDDHHGA
jgi:hypothetical protein